MANQIRVAVVGATGYAGSELVRLLQSHPGAAVSAVTSSRSAGRALRDECPWLAADLILSEFQPERVEADIVFLCQEAGFAMEHADTILDRARVIDLSADFRLRNRAVYEEFYHRSHLTATEGVYGLPELCDRQTIASARLIANPGCYPTAALLALMPLAKSGLIADGTVPVIDAKSGVSGAGRSRKETDYLFSELDGGFRAYGVSGHRHTPEIEQLFGGTVRFTPHLLPIARGLEATVHVPIRSKVDLPTLFADFYSGEPFLSVTEAQPSTKQVLGSNRCAICATYDERTGYAVVCSVLDNLVKGAAGQAIQNMNLMAGFPETMGLPVSGIWP